MKVFLITFGILLLIGGAIVAYIYYNRSQGHDEWDKKCRDSGGKVTTSGQSCDYIGCDKSKYSCWFPD